MPAVVWLGVVLFPTIPLLIISCGAKPAETSASPPAGMVLIPAGAFLMGSDDPDAAPDETPARTVYLPAFYIDRFEVTNRRYKEVFPEYAYPAGQGDRPVTNVTKQQAEAYCRAVGKRLPTNAEWEKAARGTDGRRYPWGNQFEPAKANVRHPGGSANGLRAVGSHPESVSPYGVHDMAGNAWEWVADVYDDGWVQRGILRGGAHGYGKHQARTSYQGFEGLTNTCSDTGFRCAKSIE